MPAVSSKNHNRATRGAPGGGQRVTIPRTAIIKPVPEQPFQEKSNSSPAATREEGALSLQRRDRKQSGQRNPQKGGKAAAAPIVKEAVANTMSEPEAAFLQEAKEVGEKYL